MSQPRSILAGATYLITRNIVGRQFLLRPDADTTAFITYALAVYAQHFGIRLHALCAMSSHIHAVVTDPLGKLPEFLQRFHRAIALGVNGIRNRRGTVWENEHTSVVHLITPEAIIEKIAYTLANPVIAGLVQRADEWAGAKVCVADIGRGALRAGRPLVFFSSKNERWPAQAAIEVSLPPGLSAEEGERFRGQVAVELARREASARGEVPGLEEEGEEVDGHEREGRAECAPVASPLEQAKSVRPKVAKKPVFAVGRNNKGLLRRAEDAVRAFRESYRAALEKWRGEVRDVLFPAGTWWMRVFHMASVGPAASTL